MNINFYITSIQAQTNLREQEAWWLLEYITKTPRALLYIQSKKLTDQQEQLLQEYIKQIKDEYKPLAYILGSIPFLDLTITVAPPTLIPRPETEDWVSDVIKMLKNYDKKDWKILDIGTGSGCIALALAQAFPQSSVLALDIAQTALNLAQQNAQNNDIFNIAFRQSDIYCAIKNHEKFDLIVSNPPYIKPTAQLEKSVLNWEDHGALFAPNQGNALIEKIIENAHNYLEKNDLPYQLIVEFDTLQAQNIEKIFHNHQFLSTKIVQDQFGRDRTIWAK